MKRIPVITFVSGGDGGYKFLTFIYDKVKGDIPKEFVNRYPYREHGSLALPLYEGSESYNYVMEIAKKHELYPRVFQIVYYTKSEIENAEYFQMDIDYPLELEGTNASDYGTQYEGGCSNPTCRLGGKLVGDVLVNRRFMKKGDIGSLGPDIYVSERLKDLICSNGLTGVSFEHEVKDYKGREIRKLHVMEISNVLPPMSTDAWLIPDECPHKWYEECGHQVVYLRSDIKYEREKLNNCQDFNLSVEYINNWRLREIIVTPKVRSLFKQHKIRTRFTPVAIL